MKTLRSNPVVHLELHTPDLPQACDLYTELCGWQPDWIETRAGSYLSLELGGGLAGGIVECAVRAPVWLPYVEVEEVAEATDRARRLGAVVLLDPREGPAGWREQRQPTMARRREPETTGAVDVDESPVTPKIVVWTAIAVLAGVQPRYRPPRSALNVHASAVALISVERLARNPKNTPADHAGKAQDGPVLVTEQG